ncbi:SprB repeat-containing protein, partial [Flavobacteriales bacterium]|nr:SprB repeat-containing protein [Flavobacteriales bacterium]
MKKLILFIGVVVFLLSSKQVNATHSAGMDLTYEYLTTDTVWTGNYQVNISTAAWGNECSWIITDNNTGAAVASGSGYNNNSNYSINVCIPSGNYTFDWFDSFGDGWNGGSYTVTTNTGTVLTSGSPATGSSGSSTFTSSGSTCNYTITTYPANTYRVTLKFYRDCGSGNAQAPASFTLNYNSNSCGSNNSSTMNQVSFQNITPVCVSISDPCNAPGVVGIEEYIYQTTITLPNNCPDWILSVCICCRNNAISTINGPGAQDLCVEAQLNNTNNYNNSSPIFTEYPTPYICVNQQFCYNNGAVDIDGDSLVYSLVTPMSSAFGGTVNYFGGYSASNPVTGTTTFDPLTGDLCILATAIDVTVLAMKVSEYRNGVLIGSVIRDIQVIILNNCSTVPPVLTGLNGIPDDVTTAATADITVDHCTNNIDSIIRTISATLGASTNKVMSWSGMNPSTSNPASFIIANNSSNNPTGTFSWVPDYIDVQNSPFLFTVNVTDDACPINNSFSFTYTINLTSASGFSVMGDITDVSCPSLFDGEIDVDIIGITGVPTFSWTGPNGFTSNSEDITGLEIGNYTLQITAPDGCVTSYNYDVLSNSVSLSETHIDPSCFGDSDGSIDLLLNGGVSPYTYSWIGPNGFSSASEDLFGLVSGAYDVIVTDALACSSTYSVILQDPTQLFTNGSVTSNYNGSEISCNGFSDGEITASVSGGTAPYTYSLDGVNFLIDSVFPSLSSSLHTIYYKDSNDCLINESISITSPPSLNVIVDNSDDISCYGAGDGAIAISVSGGTQNIVSPFYFYSWTSPSNGFTSALEDLSSITQSGTYYCAISDANLCGVTTPPITISEPVAITALSTKSDVSCFGYSDGSLSLVINGGNNPYTVDWTNPSAIIPQQINAPYNISFIEAGDYIYTITDANGCSGPGGVITLIQPADIGISLVNTAVTCYGIGDGVIDLTVSNITNPSFVWTNSSDLSFYETTEDISNLGQGVYNIVVTDGITNCTKSLSEVIQVLTPYNVDTDVAHESCYEVADGQINITPNSTASFTFLWEYPDGTLSSAEDVIDGIPGQYQLDISYFQLTSSAIVTCNVPYDFTIIPATEVLASVASSLVSCEGGSNGSIGLSVSGGVSPYSYLWSNTETTKDILNLTTGLYSVTVLDQKGCFWDTSFTLTSQVFDTVSVTIVPVDCKGDSTASIDIDGITGGVYPYSFSWLGPNGYTTNTEDILNVSAGTYIVDVEDAAGCVIQRYISVDQPATALSTVITNIDSVSCHGGNDGSVELSTIGGTVDNLDDYVFDWAGVNPDSLSSGTYSYIVTDLNGCQLVNSFIIPEPAEIIITPTVVEILCPGEASGSISLLLPNNISSSTISWLGPIHNNLPFVSSDFFIDELFAGDYSCVVANENGCTAQLNIYLSEPYTNAGTPTFTTSNYSNYGVSCNGGSDGWIRAGVVGGDYALDTYQYFWDNGDNTDSLYDLKADTYQLILMDNINCTDTFEYVLSQPDSIVSFTAVLSDTNGYNISCYGNSDAFIKLTALGGVYDYAYEWYKNDTLALSLNKDSVYNLEAANYYVVVTDKNNCSFADTITINQPDSLYFKLITATDTCSLNKGFAEIEPFGGVAGYKYYWSTGDLLYYVDTLSEGRYGAILQDANFCESSRPFDIANIPSPIADFTVNPSHKKLEDQLDNPFVFIDNSETFTQSISTWDWELSDNTMLVDSVAYHSFKAAGDYRVLLIIETEFNCIDTVSYKVKVESFNLWIPTAFNPNSNVIENTVF